MTCPGCGGDHERESCPLRASQRDTETLGGTGVPDSAAAPISGVLAGRYRIDERIGRGGMGEVYRARDLVLEQDVAVKFIAGDLARDERRLALLLNEVQVARQVSHPNVCRVHDVAESDGRRFLTMELIEGETLDARLARRVRLPHDEALSLARQICLGLAAAHERGVLHRDLKPSNVMVDERGVARITDFGLAAAASAVTGGRAREGTPPYMAPEALAGAQATARSDLFSLGAVLYEIFTGTPAFPAEALAAGEAAKRVAPAPPSAVAPDVHPRVEKVIRRCLESDPALRPASARAVADALPGGGTSLAGVQAAQRRADRIAAFRDELRELRAAGLMRLEPDQDEKVAAHHAGVLRDLVRDFDVDVSEREKQLSLGMRVISVLGAIALGASAFYYFYRIWGLITLPVQVAVLVAAPVAGLVVTSLIAARDRSGHFTAIAAAFALACLIADLTVLGAALNAPESPYGLLVWGAFAMILAYGYRLRMPLAAGIVLVGGFAAALPADLAGFDWANFLERPEGLIPAGLLAFVAPSLGAARRYPPFAAIYRLLGAILVLWPTFLLSLDPMLSYFRLAPATIEIVYPILGLAASAAAIAIGLARRFKDTVYAGFVFFVVHLYARCFHWWWPWMPRYLFFLILAALAIAVLLALRRMRSSIASWDDGARP